MLLLASHANGLLDASAGAGVGAGALSMNRQATLVPDAPIALDLYQALDVHRHLRRKSPSTVYSLSTVSRMRFTSSSVRLFTRVSGSTLVFVRICFSAGRPDAENVRKRYFHPLVAGYVYTGNSRHACLPYPCLCLCLGSLQITITTPDRLMMRHLAQRGFTDALTFTAISPIQRGPIRLLILKPHTGVDPCQVHYYSIT